MASGRGGSNGQDGGTTGDKVAVVKKYANRRLYNTATSAYVTLDELSQMVRDGDEFVVYDAKSGDEITRSVLTQIILEEDGKGRNLLPISFLRQVIGYYDDSLHAFLPRYLEMSMENFAKNQDQMRSYFEGTLGRFFPLDRFEDMTRQNMSLFKQAASMFTPFPGAKLTGTSEPAQQPQPGSTNVATTDEVRELREQMEEMRHQLAQLNRSQGDRS